MNTNIPALKATKSIDRDTDVVVVGLTSVGGTPIPVGVSTDLEKAWSKQLPSPLLDTVVALDAHSELDTLTALPPAPQQFVMVGLGNVDVTLSALRHACGVALRKISSTKDAENLNVTTSFELHDPELARATAESAVLGAYHVPRITQKSQRSSVAAITLTTGRAQFKESVEEAGIIAAAVIQARDWINTPPNLLCPETFVESAKVHVSDLKVGAETLDKKALAKGDYGGTLAVGGGSSRSPHLLHLTRTPRGAKFHLALVGKGITFDSGSLDTKSAGQMASMVCDMSGAAAVVVVTQAVAALGLSVKVTTYTAMAENLPSSTAYRSVGVLTMFDGATVENANTDTEGRLVMVDALGRAGIDPPNLIVDVATLTGACMMALGKRTAELMASDGATADRLLDAAEVAGEGFWHLPTTDDIREGLRSDVAGLRSSGKDRYGDALTAAAFLQHFIPEGASWAHLNIAGPAWSDESPYGYTPLGGIGVVVRTLVVLATQLAD